MHFKKKKTNHQLIKMHVARVNYFWALFMEYVSKNNNNDT